jgi:serine/threonine-protein kinase
VLVDNGRLFVKTAGGPHPTPGGLTHEQRVGMLAGAAGLHRQVRHPALVRLHAVVLTTDGVAVVQDWFDGDLLYPAGSPARQRFSRLPIDERVSVVDLVIDLHVAIESAGWVPGDFYDGCLMYGFTHASARWIDLECYRKGAYRNEVGRLPGSARFMAPEECRRGAIIDSRTAVFNAARFIQIMVPERAVRPRLKDLLDRATAVRPERRPQTVAALQSAWRVALST